MGWAEPFLQSPYVFVGLSAVCLAGALRFIVPFPRRRQRSLRARRREIAAGLFMLSFFLVCLTLALLVPGPARFFDITLLWFAVALLSVVFSGLLFPVLVGGPLLVIYSVVMVFTAGYMQSWNGVTRSVDVARLRVVAAHSGTLSVEIAPFDAGQWETLLLPVFELDGDSLSVEVDLLEAHDIWLLLGLRTGVRLTGVQSYRYSADSGAFAPAGAHRIDNPLEPVSVRVEALLRSGQLPGVKIRSLSGAARRVGLLTGYSARFTLPDSLVLAPHN
jgi:hypothetical protein